MLERENAIGELWLRFSRVPGVKRTARNPVGEPSLGDCPSIMFYEWPDVVVKSDFRGGTKAPVYTRKFIVSVEICIAGTSESSASAELVEFIKKIKKVIYWDGVTLGKRVSIIRETELSSIVRPGLGGNAAAARMLLEITYVEDVVKIM